MSIGVIIMIAIGVIFLGVSIYAEYGPTKKDDDKQDSDK